MDKPLPVPTATSQVFWESLSEGKIRIQYSPSTGAWVYYPRVLAPGSLADDLEWREISGAGSLYTFTIARRPTAPAWADSLPQILAVVELDEGPRLTTEIVNAQPEDLRIGQRVRPVFSPTADPAVTLLRYELA